MSKQQALLNLYNQQLEDLNATEQEAKKYLLSIANNNNIKQFINRFFELKNDMLDFNKKFELLLNFELFNLNIGDTLTNDDLIYQVTPTTTYDETITFPILEIPFILKYDDSIIIVLNLFVKTNKDLVISEITFEEYNSFSNC
jgi:hypothetical protein